MGRRGASHWSAGISKQENYQFKTLSDSTLPFTVLDEEKSYG